MKPLLPGLHRFRESDLPTAHRLFMPGGGVSRRGALLIVCNELQIDPYRLIPTNLADLYVLQHIGNIVVPGEGSSSGAGGVEAALALYQPTDIVICGHAPCRSLDGPRQPIDEEMPSVAAILRHVRKAQDIVEQHYGDVGDDRERRDVLARENVLVQLEHLRTLPLVAQGLDRGKLHLHGWMYRDGEIDAYDVHQGQFVPLAQ